MSTRGIIARSTGEGTFVGRYHHSDSYPTGLGAELWKLLHGFFRNDLHRMLSFLIDQHPAGWSDIVGKDFTLKPGYTWQRATEKSREFAVYSQLPDYKRPQCYCHGQRHEEEQTFTEKDLQDTDCEWLYAFGVEQRKMFVRDLNHKEDVAVVDLGDEEPDWTVIECGESFERCHHKARVHGLLPKTSDLSTQQFLEREPLGMRDAVAVIVAGKTLKVTGSGGDADFLNRTNWRFHPERKPFPSGTWIATCKYSNGRSVELPIARRNGDGWKPFQGVQWVLPATKNNPSQVVGAK